MIHLFLFICSAFGVGFHVMQKIGSLRAKFPQLKPGEIWSTFFANEWDSLIVSGLVAAGLQFAYYIVEYNEVNLPAWFIDWGIFIFYAVVNYSGQRLAYKFLNSSEKALADKIEQNAPENL